MNTTTDVSTHLSLLKTLDLFRAGMPTREVHEFRLDALDRLGIPLWGVFAWAEDGDFSDGYGYGSDSVGAQVGAWGEVLENYWATASLRTMPRKTASYNALLEGGEAAIDPVLLCLNAGAHYTADTPIVWTTAKRWPSGGPVWVPLEAAAIMTSDIANEIPYEKMLLHPITNGLGAGVSLEQAVAHGILEQVQRDGDSVTFRALDKGVRITLDEVESKSTRELLRFLDEQGIEVYAKLADVALGMPVVYVVGHDRNLDDAPFNLSISACGEAAHPDKERALRKAINEFMSSRARKRFMHGSLDDMRAVAPARYCDRVESDPLYGDESRALQGVLAWTRMDRQEYFDTVKDPVFSVHEEVSFSALPSARAKETADAAALLQTLSDRLLAEGSEVLYMDFTPPGADFFVVKSICPRLEVETMSYNRIGRRNLERLLARQAEDPRVRGLVGIGRPPAGALRIHLAAEDEAALGGPAWLDPVAIERTVGKLYALYREPNGHTVGKLQAQIACASAD